MAEEEIKTVSITGSDKEQVEESGVIVIKQQNFSEQESFSSKNFEIDTSNKVVNWGKNNTLPDILVNVSKHKSTKHSAIISRKCKMIAGGGWEEPKTEAAKEFIENKYGEHLDKIVKKVTNDYEVLNIAAIGVRWNSTKTKIAAVDYIPMHKVRKSMIAGQWKVSDDWSDPKNSKSNTQVKQQFNTEPLPDDFSELSDKKKKYLLNQIYILKNDQIGAEAYPSPTYASAMDWILADAGISSFTLNMIKKNFTGGYHINFPTGIPEADERKAEKKRFKKEYTGPEAESIIITFSKPDAANVPELKALPTTGNEDIYNETEKRCQENIFIAHEVTNPALFGIRIPGELGNKNDLEESLDIFQVVYVNQRQDDVETPFNEILAINMTPRDEAGNVIEGQEAEEERLRLKKYSLDVEDDSDDEFAEGKKLAKNLSKLDPEIKSAVLERLSDEQILSMVGIKAGEKAATDEAAESTEEQTEET